MTLTAKDEPKIVAKATECDKPEGQSLPGESFSNGCGQLPLKQIFILVTGRVLLHPVYTNLIPIYKFQLHSNKVWMEVLF